MLGMQDPTMTSLHSKHSISVGGVGWGRTPSGITHCSTYHSHEFPSTSFIRQFFFAVAERHYGTQPTVQHNVDTVGLFSLSVQWRKTFVRKQEILWGEKKRKKEEEWVNQLETEWASERLSEWVNEWVSEPMNERAIKWVTKWVTEWVSERVSERASECVSERASEWRKAEEQGRTKEMTQKRQTREQSRAPHLYTALPASTCIQSRAKSICRRNGDRCLMREYATFNTTRGCWCIMLRRGKKQRT